MSGAVLSRVSDTGSKKHLFKGELRCQYFFCTSHLSALRYCRVETPQLTSTTSQNKFVQFSEDSQKNIAIRMRSIRYRGWWNQIHPILLITVTRSPMETTDNGRPYLYETRPSCEEKQIKSSPPQLILAALCITFCCLCQPLREKPGNVPSNLRWDTASPAVSQGSIATSGREQIHDSQHKHQTQLAAHLGCNSRLYLHLFSQGDSVRVCACRMRELGRASGIRFLKHQTDEWFLVE